MFIFIAAMKRCLIILIVCCSLLNRGWGQSSAAAIDSLVKFQIITGKERSIVERELKEKGRSSYRVAILGALTNVILQKTYHINPHKTGIMFGFGGEHPDKKSQDSINKSLRLLLEKIKKANLLTDRVYTYTLKGIDSGVYIVELQLIVSLTEMSSRLEWLVPSGLLPVAELFHKTGIVSDSSFIRLENDIKNNKIESVFQLNDYCKLDRIFDLKKYPEDPDVWLEQLHRDIASILPGLNFTDFSYTTIPDTSFTIPGVRFKVSLVCNGRTYKYTSLAMSNYKNKQAKITPKDISVEDFYRIFNKILTDQQSPFRIHSIMFSPEKNNNDHFRNFALIALNDAQAEIFTQEAIFSYMMVSMDSYDSKMTSTKIDSLIVGWKKLGLFAHLSNAEISKAIDNTEAADPFSTSNLLGNFPDVIYNLHDALTAPRYPYSNLLTHFAKITHGAFNPTKIVQSKVNHGVKLQYLSNGKIHSNIFPTVYGWLDTKFSVFVKNLSQENSLPGDFYGLRYEDAVIYLTKQQHDYAVKDKLLDFEPRIKGGSEEN
jgi:hypothetical protein